MLVPGGRFDQCCNAQAVVATDSRLGNRRRSDPGALNDKQQLEPMLGKSPRPPGDRLA